MANIGFISLGCAKNQVDCERMMYRVQEAGHTVRPDVDGCDVVMIDDMTATGGTLSAAAKLLKAHGAKSIHAFVSHFPLTPKGIERLQHESDLDELVVTDSIALRDDFDVKGLPFKFTVLSVAPLIGEAISRIHEDESVNSLFKEPGDK